MNSKNTPPPILDALKCTGPHALQQHYLLSSQNQKQCCPRQQEQELLAAACIGAMLNHDKSGSYEKALKPQTLFHLASNILAQTERVRWFLPVSGLMTAFAVEG